MDTQLISSNKGLSTEKAVHSLGIEGANELSFEKSRTLFSILLGIIKEPMFYLLFVAAALYLVLGDLQEGLMLLGFVVIILGFTLYQEGKTERAVEALRDLTSPRALVIRDGKAVRIASRELVKDDIVMLAEGDRVPADGEIVSSADFEVNESLLTGEAVPVQKAVKGDGLQFVFSGSLVVKGRAVVRVTATGARSEIGRIGHALNVIKSEKSTLSLQISKLVTQITFLSLALSLVLILIYGFMYGNWLQAVLAGIALAMAILPQEYVVVMTVFPALGAWRLAKIKVLTRRLSAIETLGAVSILCVDKTGTLTENQMNVTELYNQKGENLKIDKNSNSEFPEAFHSMVELAILASIENPFDPMEKAFHNLGQRFLANTEHLHTDWTLMREYGLTQELRAMSHVWRDTKSEDYLVSAKGSPEAIIDLCHMDQEAKKKIEDQVNLMASTGLRVIGVAEARYKGNAWPGSEHDFAFKFSGLLGLSDPLRAEVFNSIVECHQAGIKVVMITGDYPLTAKTIAKEAGLDVNQILTGEIIASMSDEELQRQMQTINVCARISPEQKLRIVEALKANGEITGMTGDGVNDAPALKAAHVGIAMGERGTDVAREAASLILLDDNFISIVKAVQMGRRIFDNMQKSMTYILAIHIPIAAMAMLPVLFKMPALLFPMHIAFLELVIDPACSLAFENEPQEENLMQRPPRDTKALLMGKNVMTMAIFQGIGAVIIIMLAYYLGLRQFTEPVARAFAFAVLVVSNLALIFSNRSRHRNFLKSFFLVNKTLWIVTVATIIFLSIVLYVPFLSAVFRFSPLPLHYFFGAILVGLSSTFWFEFIKLVTRDKKIEAGSGDQ